MRPMLMILGLFIGLGAAAIVNPAARPIILLSAGVMAIVTVVVLSGRGRAARDAALARQSATAKVESLGRSHLETLARRRIVLARRDHYGVVDEAAWAKELRHFAEKVVRPALEDREAAALTPVDSDLGAAVRGLIESKVLARAAVIEADLAFSESMTSKQFEDWCAHRLKELGWTTSTTASTGDQGADVIAEKRDRRIVLQCKLYTNPVGNKAVQEAFAAQRHYRATGAAVVTNADFTRSARALASSTGVLALHHGDLDRLEDLFEEQMRRTPSSRPRRTTSATDG